MLKGIYPPIPTPFNQNEEIDYGFLKHNIEKWNKTGLTGLTVMGSNGENVYLSFDEKVELISKTREMLDKSKYVMAGTGCESAKETIKLTNAVAEEGADMALVITPNFFKGGMTNDALKSYYTRVAEESKIPVLLYNMPANTGINMSAELIIDLAKHENIVGLKESGGNITLISQVIAYSPEDFAVFAGSTSFLFPALMMGAVGGINALANVLPNEVVNLYQLYVDGKYDEAVKLQRELIVPNLAVTSKHGVPGLKFAMDMFGYKGGNVRNPLLPANDAKKEDIKKIFSKFQA